MKKQIYCFFFKKKSANQKIGENSCIIVNYDTAITHETVHIHQINFTKLRLFSTSCYSLANLRSNLPIFWLEIKYIPFPLFRYIVLFYMYTIR
jgi:hypothetical protein